MKEKEKQMMFLVGLVVFLFIVGLAYVALNTADNNKGVMRYAGYSIAGLLILVISISAIIGLTSGVFGFTDSYDDCCVYSDASYENFPPQLGGYGFESPMYHGDFDSYDYDKRISYGHFGPPTGDHMREFPAGYSEYPNEFMPNEFFDGMIIAEILEKHGVSSEKIPKILDDIIMEAMDVDMLMSQYPENEMLEEIEILPTP